MQKLVKNGQVTENQHTLLAKDADASSIAENSLVPFALFAANTDACLSKENIGVWLDSDEGPEALAPYLDKLALVAINFPKFADGRGYSYGRLLRERFGYTGEIRAIGDVLHDQLYYLSRCGFDAFAIREDKDPEAALAGLSDFSESYQTAVDQPTPLFRRRL